MNFLFNFSKDFSVLQRGSLTESRSERLQAYYSGISSLELNEIFDSYTDNVSDIQNSIRKISATHFCLILYDFVDKKLFFVNDMLGTNELYFYKANSEYLISDSVYNFNLPSESIIVERLTELLAFNVVNPPRTLFENVFIVPTGCFAIFEAGSYEFVRYFDIKEEFVPKYSSHESLVEDFREKFCLSFEKDINKKTLVALSGGVDSGGILSILNKKLGLVGVKSISVGPYGKGSGDLISSRQTVNETSSENYEIYPAFDDLKKMPDFFKGQSQPVEGMFTLTQSLIFDKAKKLDAEIVYYGIGVDNMLGVSRHHKLMYYLETFEKYLPYFFTSIVYKIFAVIYKYTDNQKRILLEKDPVKRFLYLHSPLFHYEKKHYLLSSDPYDLTGQEKELEEIISSSKLGIIDKYILADWKYYYTYSLNGAACRLAKRFGLTAISNMYQPDVLMVLLKATTNFRKRGKWDKKIIREMFKPYVSERLYKNAPKSCIVDSNAWFKGKEVSVIEYLKTNSLLQKVIDFDKLSKNYPLLPEPGTHLFKLLGIAIWYDSNWDEKNIVNYQKIFKGN